MKPGGGLRRGTVPLRRTELKPAATPLRRRIRLTADPDKARARQQAAMERARAPKPPAERTAPKPRKRTTEPGESTAKRHVRERSQGLCEMRLRGCSGTATQFCHRKAKGRGGRWCASNGIHGCTNCHYLTTNTRGHRSEYVRNGWTVTTNARPESRLVLLAALGGEVLESPVVALLTRDGRVVLVDGTLEPLLEAS